MHYVLDFRLWQTSGFFVCSNVIWRHHTLVAVDAGSTHKFTLDRTSPWALLPLSFLMVTFLEIELLVQDPLAGRMDLQRSSLRINLKSCCQHSITVHALIASRLQGSRLGLQSPETLNRQSVHFLETVCQFIHFLETTLLIHYSLYTSLKPSY